jgi:F-type H+-transporting ATPase subunit delta
MSVARRYSQALLDLVVKDPAKVADRLVEFDQIIRENPLLKEVLVSPAFRLQERRKVFDRLLGKLAWGAPLDRFLWYLVEHRRIELIGGIAEAFQAMVDRRAGKVRVEVSSARPLDQSTGTRLSKVLSQALGKTVVMKPRVDQSLIAGLSVRVGDLVVDGSLKTQLNSLREALTRKS